MPYFKRLVAVYEKKPVLEQCACLLSGSRTGQLGHALKHSISLGGFDGVVDGRGNVLTPEEIYDAKYYIIE